MSTPEARLALRGPVAFGCMWTPPTVARRLCMLRWEGKATTTGCLRTCSSSRRERRSQKGQEGREGREGAGTNGRSGQHMKGFARFVTTVFCLLTLVVSLHSQTVIRTGDINVRGLKASDFPRITKLAENVFGYEQLDPT